MQASEALKYFRLLDFFQADFNIQYISAAHCGRQPRGPGNGQGESPGPRIHRALSPLLWARGFLPGPSLDPLALGHSALRLLYSKVCRPECWRDEHIQTYIHLYLESGETELEDGTVENK